MCVVSSKEHGVYGAYLYAPTKPHFPAQHIETESLLLTAEQPVCFIQSERPWNKEDTGPHGRHLPVEYYQLFNDRGRCWVDNLLTVGEQSRTWG